MKMAAWPRFYVSMGSALFAKETMTMSVGDASIMLIDYKLLTIYRSRMTKIESHQDKGHRECLGQFSQGIKNQSWPIPLNELLRASEISLEVERQLQ